MADPVVADAPARPLTLEEKKEQARARARAAREEKSQGGGAGLAVSDAAATYIREAADREGMEHGVRLQIHAGGCSGLEYSIDLLERGATPQAAEREIESNGVRVLLDLKSAIYVSGSVVDYTSSLMRSGFVIQNPNATTTCSCGESFGV